MSVDAPLSHGQLHSWREVETYPLDWMAEANLATAWDLRGCTLERVQVALQRLVDRNEPLRTTYHVLDGQPVQRIHPNASPRVELVDRVVPDRDDPYRTKQRLASVPFSMTNDPGWRGILVSTGGAPVYLALSFSHLIVDVWATRNLHDQFRALLANPDAAVRPAPSPRQLAQQQRGPAERERQHAAHRHWSRVLAEPVLPQWPTLPAGVKRPRIQATLHSDRLAEFAARAATRNGVTAPAVFMAVVTAALARHTDTDRVPLSLMAANRFTPRDQRLVGTMNQLVPLVVEVNHRTSLAEHIRNVHTTSARAYRYSSYDLDLVAALAASSTTFQDRPRRHDCWFNHLFPCWFNHLQLDSRPADPAQRRGAELAWAPLARQFGQPFDLKVSVRHGRTSVALRADPDLLTDHELAAMLRGVAAGVQFAAADPSCRLTDLRHIEPDAPPPSLFPRQIPAPPW